MLTLLTYLLAAAAGAAIAGIAMSWRGAERKAAAEQLHASDARLKRAQRGANDGLWELDVATREMWVSPRFAEMFDFDHEEFLGARQKFFEILDAEDAARLRDAIERSIREGVLVD